jgi:hypothetical protein
MRRRDMVKGKKRGLNECRVSATGAKRKAESGVRGKRESQEASQRGDFKPWPLHMPPAPKCLSREEHSAPSNDSLEGFDRKRALLFGGTHTQTTRSAPQ